MINTRFIALKCLVALSLCPGWSLFASELNVDIVYLEQQIERPPVLSNLVERPEDTGLQGATLGIADNNTTGKFLKQNYTLETVIAAPDQDLASMADEILSAGEKLVVINADAATLLKIADSEAASDDLIFNAGSADIELRNTECRPNVFHTLPSRAMLTDALMQFFKYRRWESIFLLQGNRPGDALFADSIRRSANKFRIDIDHEKQWLDDADMRRNAAAEIPGFTQARRYDVVVVADEDDDFGQYVLYNTWLPRPVAGTAGVEPVAWHRVVEQWGAAQLQSRFSEQAERVMNSVDYAAWAAVRTIGEAVTRTKSAVPSDLKAFVLSDGFNLAGFKGVSMNYRPWNQQLRQPIPLVHPESLVALAPLEGFLHQHNELDTLGLDQPETNCSIEGS